MALHGLNVTKNSSDLTLSPVLWAEFPGDREKPQALLERFRGVAKSEDAPRVAYLEGRTHQRSQRWPKAVEAFTRAIRLDKTSREPYTRLLEVLDSIDDPETTERSLADVSELEPER